MDTLFKKKGGPDKFLRWVESPPSREQKNLKSKRERGGVGGGGV
jgi:hypothetical protein